MKKILSFILLMIVLVGGCISGDSIINDIGDDIMATEVQASHILVKTEKEANDLLSKLNLGESFDKLAQQNSLCPSGQKGGDLGWFGKGVMVKEFEDIAFSLIKGGISQPIKTQFGWHIIKVVDKK